MKEMLDTLTEVLKGLSVQQTPPIPKVRLQKFRGPPKTPGEPSLKEWLEEFDTDGNCYKLTGKSKAQAVVDHLAGPAKEEVLCTGVEVKEDFEEIVRFLKSQFSPYRVSAVRKCSLSQSHSKRGRDFGRL